MNGSQPGTKNNAICLPLDLLLIFSGRAAIAAGDNLVAVIDGINAARCSLYRSNIYHNGHSPNSCGNNYFSQREARSIRGATAITLGQAAITGVVTALKNVSRYYHKSNQKMSQELRSVFDEYILGSGKG